MFLKRFANDPSTTTAARRACWESGAPWRPSGPVLAGRTGHHRRQAGRDGKDDRLPLPVGPVDRRRPDLELLPRGRRPGDDGCEDRFRELVADEPRGTRRDAPAPRGLLRERRFELLALLAFEIGKDWYEADAEIAEAIDFCEYYAGSP